jgi:hypothetical protein
LPDPPAIVAEPVALPLPVIAIALPELPVIGGAADPALPEAGSLPRSADRLALKPPAEPFVGAEPEPTGSGEPPLFELHATNAPLANMLPRTTRLPSFTALRITLSSASITEFAGSEHRKRNER